MIETKVKIRPYVENDFNFICNSWLKAYELSETVKHMPSGLYKKFHRGLINRCLEDGDCYIACNAKLEDQIYGYIVVETDCVHFIYVKKVFRGMGIGEKLMTGAGIQNRLEFSHYLPQFFRLTSGRLAIYNLYRFFGRHED